MGYGAHRGAAKEETVPSCNQMSFLWEGRGDFGAHFDLVPLDLGYLGCHFVYFWCYLGLAFFSA